jgi:hypothetical protein
MHADLEGRARQVHLASHHNTAQQSGCGTRMCPESASWNRKFKHPSCDSTLLTYCLVLNIELVFERLSRYDGTLIDKGTTVGRIGPMLVDTVPMLHENMNKTTLYHQGQSYLL